VRARVLSFETAAEPDSTAHATHYLGDVVDNEPEWSPDGERIVFVGMRGETNPDVYTINTNGLEETRVTYGPQTETLPSWSPDGRRIVFAASRNGNMEIVVVNVDGTGEMVISNDPGFDGYPGWSR